MYPGSATPDAHAQAQPTYRLNITKLRWREIRRASGNPFVFLMSAGVIAFCKLFRVRLAGAERFPAEITFAPADVAALGPRAQQVDSLFRAITALGFEHFSTFRVPELPYDSMVFALMHQAEQSYADVYHIITPMKIIVYYEFVTCLADDGGLTSTSNRDSAAIDPAPKSHRLTLPNADPATLWEAHRARLAELAPAAGGIAGPVGPEHYSEAFRRAWRRNAEYMVGRGVWEPV